MAQADTGSPLTGNLLDCYNKLIAEPAGSTITVWLHHTTYAVGSLRLPMPRAQVLDSKHFVNAVLVDGFSAPQLAVISAFTIDDLLEPTLGTVCGWPLLAADLQR